MRIKSDYKLKIGDIINNLEIIECFRKEDKDNKLWKYYRYKCLSDGYIGESSEYSLLKNHGCPVCSGRVALLGINTIYDIDKWMIPYVGEEVAKLSLSQSNKPIYPTCPCCGYKKKNKMKISDIYKYKGFKCPFCNDGIPYPEKIMLNVFEQIGVKLITQLSKTNVIWCGKFRYDFYFKIDNEKYIIETNGKQHYEEGFQRIKSNKKAKTLEEVKVNDRLKRELALENGIEVENYIVIDCRKSEIKFIKENILDSRLTRIFDLSIIDWLKAEEFARNNNNIKKTCELKYNNKSYTSKNISDITGYSVPTIIKWLKIGNELKWCHYDVEEEIKLNYEKSKERGKKLHSKLVEIFKDGISLGMFESSRELERQSEKLFGVKFSYKCISRVCLNTQKEHRGYTFKYTT